MPWVAGAIGVGTAVNAGTSLAGSGKAASAAKDSANLNKMMYMMTRNDLSPYNAAGQGVLPAQTALALSGPTGGGPDYIARADAMQPGQMTQAELEATPGYQFTLGQGLKSVQSANAAKGLGVSGAALKGAATYATGLADSTYKTQFDVSQKRFEDVLALNTGQQGNLLNLSNRLNQISTLGANAASATGTQGTMLANQAGNALIKSGEFQQQGLRDAGNALNSGINDYLGYRSYQDMIKSGGTKGYG